MAQFARPDEDISFSSLWNVPASDKYADIDEVVASDDEANVASLNFTSTTGFGEFGLSAVQDPNSAALHIIGYRAKRTDLLGVCTVEVRAILKEDTTVIATTDWITLTDAYQNLSYTLSSGEAGAITNAGYATGLRLRFEIRTLDASIPPDEAKFVLSWAEFEVPATTPATPTGFIITPDWHNERLEWEFDPDTEVGFIVERRKPPIEDFEPLIVIPPVVPPTIILIDPIIPPVVPPPNPPTYCYRVYAFNSYGNSDPTDEVCSELSVPITSSITIAIEPAKTTYFKERGESETYATETI